MLPEPAVPEPNPRLPALPLGAEALAAARLRERRRDLEMQMGSNVEPVPARLTPRGSLVALAGGSAEDAHTPVTPPPRVISQDAPVVSAAKVTVGQANDDQNPFRSRAEAAEQQASKLRVDNKKLEAEVRKLRADAYFQRLRKSGQAPGPRGEAMDREQEGQDGCSVQDIAADGLAGRLQAEERAVKAEAEVLRLHTELHAARIQFAILSEKGESLTTCPPPPRATVEDKEGDAYEVRACLRYVCGCVRFFIFNWILSLYSCICCRPSRKHHKMVDGKEDEPQKSVKNFCVVDRA